MTDLAWSPFGIAHGKPVIVRLRPELSRTAGGLGGI